jgi:hypothetical protein
MSDETHRKDATPQGAAEAEAAFSSSHEIDFITFVMSLATSVLMQLGENEEGAATGPADLPLAKQTIDIIGMLRDKTRGNLTPDETRVLDGVLYDLRMRYLKQSRG